ncbi:MAG TPA: alpha/beta hydrolase [Acidimicrobiaceae bacterium]|jgi:3-oxoadipate enol-lactonase|nr:alpha/beta hydrolase [Acidimicrobiales bacterium]HAA67360.1 alpha/beta hydrolase [Acidimicrobiaceae bacterium]HAY65255.1 alpha/beta hydrolase [Acidimicrobiaceae bacterium]HCK73936.1 alpha/beta hydrolase [Acidimicrobiaceae bacterium]|tara:strand:- start:1047 stop:1835 length:789 start_codon:yes stop_codon:yes gene_type:complete
MREQPFFWAHGDSKENLLFCMHGIGSCADAFLPQRALASALGCTVVAWDAPGYRYSADPAHEIGIDGWADAAAELIASLGYDRTWVLGVSWGGVTATRLALRTPSAVDALILADSSVGSGTSAAQAQAMRGRAESLSEMGAEEFARQRAPLLIAEGASKEILSEVEHLFADSVRMPSYQWACNSMADTDHRPNLNSLEIPTLVMCGDQDRVTPPKLSAELAMGIPDASHVQISDAGHLANQEQPEKFNSEVLEFIEKLIADN